MTLAYSEEPSPLGTGGALRAALDQFDSETILLLNGDSYCRLSLASFAAFHRRRGAEASLALARVDDAARFGRVATAPDGRVTAFAEKEAGGGSGWINAGVYLLQRSLLEEIPTGRPVSLEHGMLLRLGSRNGPCTAAGVEDRSSTSGRRSHTPPRPTFSRRPTFSLLVTEGIAMTTSLCEPKSPGRREQDAVLDRESGAATAPVAVEFAGWLPCFAFFGDCGRHPQFSHTDEPPPGYRFVRSEPAGPTSAADPSCGSRCESCPASSSMRRGC